MFAALGSSLTKILVSVKWGGFIKFTNHYTHRQKESGRDGSCSWKQLWKFQVNETNLGKKCTYICIKSFLYKILLWQLKLLSTISIIAIKIKVLKYYQKCFFIYQEKLLLSSWFSKFCTSLFLSFIRSWPLLIL